MASPIFAELRLGENDGFCAEVSFRFFPGRRYVFVANGNSRGAAHSKQPDSVSQIKFGTGRIETFNAG
jgi:hypothetical protein